MTQVFVICPSSGVRADAVYRKDTPRGLFDFMPDISQRCLAVRSGVGWVGLSGNVITRTRGAAVILGCTVTTAALAPSDPLPAAGTCGNECRLCRAACASGLMDPAERPRVTIGGMEFGYPRRRSSHRRDLVCGFTGLAKNGKRSTWSPGRFRIPEQDEEVRPALRKAIRDFQRRPEGEGGFYHPVMPGRRKLKVTCGNCQLLCHPDRAARKRRYRPLTRSGVVGQPAAGALAAVSPAMARRHLIAMSGAQRACYEDVSAQPEPATGAGATEAAAGA